MAKQVVYKVNIRHAVLRGINQLADAVKVTPGPKGRNVVIDKKYGSPTITKDGVTVARRSTSRIRWRTWARDGAKSKQNVRRDPATTATTVLAQAIYREGAKESAGANPMDVKRGVERPWRLTGEIKRMSKPVSGNMVAQSAISANNDETIGASRTRWTRWARTGDHGRRGQEIERRWMSSKACNSTAATCRPASAGPRPHGGRPRRQSSDPREDQLDEGSPAGARAGGAWASRCSSSRRTSRVKRSRRWS